MNDVWIQTYTGKKFYILNPIIENIDILDIAHALSNICRFTGHCKKFYSVAQHSVILSNLVSKENALKALLHDASEAYICDLSSPIKILPELDRYKKIEKNIEKCIYSKFNLSIDNNDEVKYYDMKLLVTEARQFDLMSKDWKSYKIKPLNIKIFQQNPIQAEKAFLNRFEEIKREK